MTAPVRVLSVDLAKGWRGGENQVYLLQRGLRELGAPVASTVLCRAGEALGRRLADEGLPSLPVAGALAAVRAMRRAIRRGEVDLLHAHTGRAHGLCLLAASATSVPVVVTRRVDFAVGGGLAGRRKYGPRVARFVAISSGVRRVLEAGGVPGARITTIPSGVDPARVVGADGSGVRAGLELPADEPLVLCAAALVDHKDHDTLLRAWAAHEARGGRGTLLVAGDGPRSAAIAALHHELGLRRCRLLGWREDVPRLLAAADVFVLSSCEEGLGTALLDAAFAGVPIAATAAGGIVDVVADGDTGLLAPVGDHDTLSRQIDRLLTDRTLASDLATAARRRAEDRFHYHAMTRSYIDLYRSLIRSRRGR